MKKLFLLLLGLFLLTTGCQNEEIIMNDTLEINEDITKRER